MIANRVENYRNVIKECFSQDEALLDKWHLEAGNGLEKCVEATHRDMVLCNVDFYTVTDDENLVGYFGKEIFDNKEFLTGFFVRPEYRNGDDLGQYWSIVKSGFKFPIYCGLFEKNKPAIDFINRNGGKPFSYANAHGQPVIIFRVEK